MKKIVNVVVIEFRKAFISKKFLLGTASLLIFSMLSAIYMIESRAGYNPAGILKSMKDGELTRNPTLSLITFYNSWVGGDELSLAAALFYTLLPVGAALPFGWSYYTERKSGYLKNIYSRVDKKTYLKLDTSNESRLEKSFSSALSQARALVQEYCNRYNMLTSDVGLAGATDSISKFFQAWMDKIWP